LCIEDRNKKEAYCTESDVDKEVTFSKAEDGHVIGFEILNYPPKGTKREVSTIPIETKIVRE
jgi:uncharacterized protein YuzE